MKRFLFSCAFFLLTTLAFSQSIEDKASFLTNEMNTLLSLTTEQIQKVNKTNTSRFKVEGNAKARLAENARYQNAKLENFQSTAGQQMLQQLNSRIAQAESRYDLAMSNTLDASQYAIYLQNKTALLNTVVTEFGE